jgi:hypothetical protein
LPSVRKVVAVKLEKFRSARVLSKHHEVTSLRIKQSAHNWLGEEGKLASRAAGHFDQVQLLRVRETRGDQNLAACGMPVVECRGAEFEIEAHAALHFRRSRWNALDNEIVRQLGESTGPAKNCQAEHGKSVVHSGGGDNRVAILVQ